MPRNDPHFWQLTATDLAAAFAAKTLSPSVALGQYMQRIQRLNEPLNAFVAFSDEAIDEARASDARWAAGRPLSPFDGVPIAIKDNMVVRGMPATWGCPHYADNVPDADELPVAKLRDAGLIIVGKTNVPEFTIEGYTGNPIYGVTGNPWNPVLTPGGSSGGSVAAVAAGLVPLAIGTDGGGSTRRPAAYAGLVGLKPSIGAIARDGGLPQILLDFEVVGLFSRDVGDVETLFGILAGPDARDHRSRTVATIPTPPAPLRVLYVERFGEAPLDPVIADRVAAAVDGLAALGCTVKRGALPFDISPIDRLWPTIGMTGLAGLIAADPGLRDAATEKYVKLADQGAAVPAHDLLAGLEQIAKLRAAVAQAFQDVDIIVTPSCAAMPWPAAEAYPPKIDGQDVGPRGHAIYTGWVNACGHPGLNLPADPAPDGMPIGFQMIADMGGDALLLDLAKRFEAARPWKDRWPEMAADAD